MKCLVGKVNDNEILVKMAKMFDGGGCCYSDEVLREYFSKWLHVPNSCFSNYIMDCFEPWFMTGNGTYNLGEIYKSDDSIPQFFLVFKVVGSFAFTIRFIHM